MSELVIPTVGRVVHYYPNESDAHCEKNHVEYLPAVVIQVFGKRLNLAVTCMNPDAPVVLRTSVPHKTEVTYNEEEPVGTYWSWPQY